jgi:hypothetical protein
MGNTKKCYHCSTEVDEDEKICPRCKKKLGAKGGFGIAKKPGSLLLKILVIVLLIAIVGRFAGHSSPANSAAVPGADTIVIEKNQSAVDYRDGIIKEIKQKGAQTLGTLGVADVGYKDDMLRVYVDQRFSNLAKSQQEQLVKIMGNEWAKAIGKDSAAVEILEYETKKTLGEWTIK